MTTFGHIVWDAFAWVGMLCVFVTVVLVACGLAVSSARRPRRTPTADESERWLAERSSQ